MKDPLKMDHFARISFLLQFIASVLECLKGFKSAYGSSLPANMESAFDDLITTSLSSAYHQLHDNSWMPPGMVDEPLVKQLTASLEQLTTEYSTLA